MSTTVAPPAQIAGQSDFQKWDWLPEALGLAWFDELGEAHRAAVRLWSDRVEAVGDLIDEADRGQAAHRDACRAAITAGKPTPTPPDPVAAAMALSLGQEDVCRAEEELAEVVVTILGVLRARRDELEPHLGKLSDPVLASLTRGPGGRRALVGEELRRRLARLGELKIPGIENVDAPTGKKAA